MKSARREIWGEPGPVLSLLLLFCPSLGSGSPATPRSAPGERRQDGRGSACRPRPGLAARTHAHSHTYGAHQTLTAAEGLLSQAPSPITTLLAGQWAPVSVLLAPVLYDAGNSISSRRWKINLDRAFPFLLRIRTHPGKPELPERGRSGSNRHPRVLPRPSPSRSARGSRALPKEETPGAEQ